MHQPPLITHKEGMGASKRKIVHRLAALDHLDPTYCLDLAVELRNEVAKAQILGIDPTTVKGVEGIIWCSLDRLIAAAKPKSEERGHKIKGSEIGNQHEIA